MACLECGGQKQLSYSNSVQRTPVSKEEGPVTQVMPWTGLPMYKAAELPEDLEFIAGSDEEGKAWRVPVQRILPGGELNPLRYTIPKKTSDIEIPRGQVLPVFVPNSLEPVELARGITNETAQALAVAEDPNDATRIVLQQTGFLTFPRTHMYTVGKTYYLSQSVPGEVVSVRPSSGIVQPLFTVIDELTLAIHVQGV